MDSEQYAITKKLFFELTELSPKAREIRLQEIRIESPDIADELFQLLSSSSSRTIIGRTDHAFNTPSNTKSLTTIGWVRFNRLLFGGIMPLLIAIVVAMLLASVGALVQREVYRRESATYQTAVRSVADQKVRRVLQWIRWNELQMQSWGQREDFQRIVADLDSIAKSNLDAASREQKLRESPSQQALSEAFKNISLHFGFAEGEINDPISAAKEPPTQNYDPLRVKYAIWNRSFQLLADWQFEKEGVNLGEGASSSGKITISNVFESNQIIVELPQPAVGTISKDYPLETEAGYVMFFVPIFAQGDTENAVAAMMIRSDALLDEIKEILGDLIFSESNCYLLSKDGVIASPVLDDDKLRAHPLFTGSQPAISGTVLHARDPGGNIFEGKNSSSPPISWPLTKAAVGIAAMENGEEFGGYRDYRGVPVIGAWRWIDRANAGIILEVPESRAFENLNYINRAFTVMIAVPLLTAIGLIGFSIVRQLRQKNFMNTALGSYRLKSKIGEGGLGIVYAGEHSMLGRQAAIKLIKPGSVTSGTIRRFEREVRLASMLNHQNAVGIYDFGVSKDGTLFCAMELVQGVTLSQLLSVDPYLPFERIVHFLTEISRALTAAHSLHLVHRDIKPQNVMICRFPISDRVKVVDFGLAKSISGTINLDVTATRAVMGTPGFIAPERLESPWSADPKIDIFSFGVLGMYLIASRIPSLGIGRAGFEEMIRNPHFKDRLAQPEIRELISLLLDCATPIVEQRPSTILEVSHQLQRLSNDFPWSAEMAEAWWNEHAKDLV